jgi:ABC-type dipeptide/oligopeptide/nickel transport system ATPase subunit
MAKVAIVGTRGSGKTTLMTVLAKRYQKKRADGLFLRAMNKETMAFTEKNWRRLTQELNWPPQTPPGELQQLNWVLQKGNDVHEIKLVDFAGETFRDIFGKNDVARVEVHKRISEDPVLGPLLKYMDAADSVILLVNLRDFINDNDFEVAMETQWALRGALDYLANRKVKCRNIAVVLTQVDLYPELVNNRPSIAAVIEEHLPQLQIVQSYPEVKYLGVSAVYETTVESGANGIAMIRPASEFKSLYLEDIIGFLTTLSRLDQHVNVEVIIVVLIIIWVFDCLKLTIASIGWGIIIFIIGWLLLPSLARIFKQ